MIFIKNNNIPYGQDMQFKRDVPSGVDFEVRISGKRDRVFLRADGYGNLDGNYGNGRISISFEDYKLANQTNKESK